LNIRGGAKTDEEGSCGRAGAKAKGKGAGEERTAERLHLSGRMNAESVIEAAPAAQPPQDPMNQTKSGGFRPSSAVKKPPKIASTVTVEENVGKKMSGPSNVIMDRKGDDDDDDGAIIDDQANGRNGPSKGPASTNAKEHTKLVREAMQQVQNNEVKSIAHKLDDFIQEVKEDDKDDGAGSRIKIKKKLGAKPAATGTKGELTFLDYDVNRM
jgi:hypothetical protein